MSSRFLRYAPFMLLLGSTFTCLAAENWPRFRGPNGLGTSEVRNLPIQWSENDYRWKIKLPGIGHSSPVIWGDRVYVTSADEKAGTVFVQCLKAANGEEAWQRKFTSDTYEKNAFNSYAASTPALDEQHLYVTWAGPKVYFVVALDRTSGQEVWRRDLGPFVANHGFGCSPIVFEDLVIVPNEQDAKSSIVAMEAQTGKTRWEAPRRSEKAAYSTPCIFQPEGGPPQLILTSWAHGVSSLDPRSGKALWEIPALKARVVGSPSLAAGLIFAAAGEGSAGKQMVAVRPAEPERGIEAQIAYQVPSPLPYVPTAVAKGPLVFLWHDSGLVTCLEAATGKVHWRERIGGNFFSSPVRAGDRLYGISREGDMVVIAAAAEYKLLARFPLGERSHSTPAIAGDTMYLRTASQLMALGAGK